MIKGRMTRNGKDASNLIAALLSNVRALQNQASRLSGDVRRLRRKIDATHHATDRLHLKTRTARARSDSSVGGAATSSQTEWAVNHPRL
jgi:hypothetical protein